MKVFKRPNVEAQVVNIDLTEHAGKTVDIAAFPAGTILTDVRLTVESPFSSGCKASLAMGSVSVISATAIDSITELKNQFQHRVVSGNNKLSLTLDASTTGAGFVTAKYILPTKTEAEY